METLSKEDDRRCIVARYVVTSAENCSHRTTRGSAIIATGRWSRANCNLNYKNSFCIPIIFHNSSDYDAHFIIKEIAIAYDGNVDVLPITKEKFILFNKHVDSTKDKNEKNFQKNA